MSSPIGHSLAAAILYFLGDRAPTRLHQKLWFVWLIILASLPDLDYIVPFLKRENYYNARVTHSFAFSLLFPLCTIVGLFWLGNRGKKLAILGLEAIAASLSHLVLDLLVCVTPLPLLFPFHSHLFKLPFGILPSSWTPNPTDYPHLFKELLGSLPSWWPSDLKNYFLYRQIAIELGILLPWTWIGLVYSQDWRLSSRHSIRPAFPPKRRLVLKIIGLPIISLGFMIWAWSLSR